MNKKVRPKLSRNEVIARIFEEVIYSGFVYLGLFIAGPHHERYIYFIAAWIAISILTSVSSYTGQLTRIECKDLRFIWYSLHKRIPEWIIWLFWATAAAVLLSPLYALCAYISVGFAFYRGFWFRRHCMGYRFITFIDISVRIAGGFIIGNSI